MLLVDLQETLSTNDIEQKFVKLAVEFGMGGRSSHLTFLTQQMVKRYPRFKYDGVMYRVLAIPYDVITKSNSVVDVLNFIRSNANYHDVISWSKSIKGVIRYHNLVATKTPKPRVFVIIEQQHTGFDFRPWIKSYVERGLNPGLLYSSEQVFEVLSPMTKSARIGMLFVFSNGEYNKFMVDDFAALKTTVKQLTDTPRTSVTFNNVNQKSKYASELSKLSTDNRKSRVGIDFYKND